MSELPKPKALPKPKRSGGDKELSDLSHQNLLDWLWNNMEIIVAGKWHLTDKTMQRMREDAIYRYKVDFNELMLGINRLAEANASHPSVSKLIQVHSRLENHLSAFEKRLGDVPFEFSAFTLKSKHYQPPVYVRKHDRDGNARQEVVGYVDASATITAATEIALKNIDEHGRWTGFNVPYGLDPRHRHGQIKKNDDAAFREYVDEVFSLGLPETQWAIRECREITYYLDVRAELPTTGELVRELRVLGDLVFHEPKGRHRVALVGDGIPKDVVEILEHEGFEVFDRQLITP